MGYVITGFPRVESVVSNLWFVHARVSSEVSRRFHVYEASRSCNMVHSNDIQTTSKSEFRCESIVVSWKEEWWSLGNVNSCDYEADSRGIVFLNNGSIVLVKSICQDTRQKTSTSKFISSEKYLHQTSSEVCSLTAFYKLKMCLC